jgi:hypothetical protein
VQVQGDGMLHDARGTHTSRQHCLTQHANAEQDIIVDELPKVHIE